MTQSNEWDALRSEMKEQSYDWNTCCRNARRKKQVSDIKMWSLVIVLEVIFLYILTNHILVFEPSVYQITENPKQMILYVDGKQKIIERDADTILKLDARRVELVLPCGTDPEEQWLVVKKGTAYGWNHSFSLEEVKSLETGEISVIYMEKFEFDGTMGNGDEIYLIYHDSKTGEGIKIQVVLP